MDQRRVSTSLPNRRASCSTSESGQERRFRPSLATSALRRIPTEPQLFTRSAKGHFRLKRSAIPTAHHRWGVVRQRVWPEVAGAMTRSATKRYGAGIRRWIASPAVRNDQRIASATAAETAVIEAVAGLLPLAEELFVTHHRLTGMIGPPMPHVSFVIG